MKENQQSCFRVPFKPVPQMEYIFSAEIHKLCIQKYKCSNFRNVTVQPGNSGMIVEIVDSFHEL